jgi:hypothetical protein
MSHDIQFGWISESRRSVLQGLLANLVDDWAREWWLDYANGQVTVVAVEEPAHSSRRGLPLLSSDDAGAIAIQLSTRDVDGVGRHLASTASDEGQLLAQRIGEEALANLVLRIRQRAGSGKAPVLSKAAMPMGLEHARLGAFAVAATLGRLSMELVIDRHIADRLAPPVAAAPRQLAPRHQALQQAPLRVVAMMDFGAMDLAQLSDLSVGEVLVGDRRLDEPLRIHLEGYGAVATAFLRRLDEQRAVVLDGVHAEEGKDHE